MARTCIEMAEKASADALAPGSTRDAEVDVGKRGLSAARVLDGVYGANKSVPSEAMSFANRFAARGLVLTACLLSANRAAAACPSDDYETCGAGCLATCDASYTKVSATVAAAASGDSVRVPAGSATGIRSWRQTRVSAQQDRRLRRQRRRSLRRPRRHRLVSH